MTAGASSLPTGRSRVLTVCDGLLREVGRREHRFSWLRDPDASEEEWLVVDGYYPSNKLVVYAGSDPDERSLYRQLVPEHGLYLLTVEPDDLPDDPIAAQALVRKQLESDGWSPRPSPKPVAAAPPPAPAAAKPQAQPGHWTKVHHTAQPEDPRQATTAGFGMGLLLIVIVLLEAYLGLVVLAINHGDVVLGAGLLLDATARTMGTLGARQRHDPEQTWASLLIGSPAVAGHEQPAKLVAIAALVLSALGIVVAIL